jgi:hypothetical protein
MNLSAQQFSGVIPSVIQSQSLKEEVLLSKQPVLADYGHEVRVALNQLPPEVSRSLMSAYQPIEPSLTAEIQQGIEVREQVAENAATGKNLDQQWVAQEGVGRKIKEEEIGADDGWNIP